MDSGNNPMVNSPDDRDFDKGDLIDYAKNVDS